MKRILLALVIPWSLVGAPLPAVAQSPELMAAYRQYEALKAQGKYAEAEPFARKALELPDRLCGTENPSEAARSGLESPHDLSNQIWDTRKGDFPHTTFR